MIYYCTDCHLSEEIDDKEIVANNVKVPEVCPNCQSINVVLSKEGGPNWKIICWWILGAPLLGVYPFEKIAEFIGPWCGVCDFFTPMELVGWILVGLAPKFIKKKKIKNLYTAFEKALNANDYKTAEQRLTDILSWDPYDAKAYCERGKVRSKNKQIELATDDFVNMALLEPSNMDYAYYRTTIFMAYMDEEAYNIAIERFTALILSGYVKAECFNSRGECYLLIHKYEKALADFEKAIKINPSNEIYKNNKKIVLSKSTTDDFINNDIQETTIETMSENHIIDNDVKIDIPLKPHIKQGRKIDM